MMLSRFSDAKPSRRLAATPAPNGAISRNAATREVQPRPPSSLIHLHGDPTGARNQLAVHDAPEPQPTPRETDRNHRKDHRKGPLAHRRLLETHLALEDRAVDRAKRSEEKRQRGHTDRIADFRSSVKARNCWCRELQRSKRNRAHAEVVGEDGGQMIWSDRLQPHERRIQPQCSQPVGERDDEDRRGADAELFW